MKAKKKKTGGIPYTKEHGRIVQQVFNALDGAYGKNAQNYIRGYIRIWKRYCELTEKGLKVKISPPKFGGRKPMLIIEK